MNASAPPFPILYQDADIMVILKPAGLACHRGPKTLHALEDQLPSLGRHRPVLAHRLDRDTSGCLALGLNPRGVKALALAFGSGRVSKLYWAQLAAPLAAAAGTVTAPLLKVSTAATGWRMVVDARGKPAVTHWQVLDAATRLVAFRPETGRTHQIRVHAAHIGAPIMGDPVYGDGVGPMRLHARALAITLADGRVINAEAPLPAAWRLSP